jgi:type 1 glutamine amidotransferase
MKSDESPFPQLVNWGKPMTRTTVLAALALLPVAMLADAEDPAPAIRVLILTGRNNHHWKETTPKLQNLLEAAGRFAVDTAVPPEGLTRDNLQNYDVILSNWNSWGKGSKQAEAEWTDEVRRAYLDFVRQGKAHVTIHAGGSSFYDDWPEYRKVALVFWNLGVTGHGRQHEFKVRIDRPDHAVTAGLSEFTIRDELWNKPGVVDGATILASAYSDKQDEARGTGQWEPSVVFARYGQGRCFATLLGHDAKIMDNDGFRQLLIRGVEWAATGKITGKP